MLIAALLAFGAWVLVVGAASWSRKRGSGILHWLFYPCLLSSAVATFLSPRSFEVADALLMGEMRHPIAKWTSRFVTLYLLVASAERIFSRLLTRPDGTSYSRRLLMTAFSIYWLSNIAVPAIFGARPAFSHELIYAFIIGLGVLSLTPEEARHLVLAARNATLLFLLASLLTLFVRRDLVLDPDYTTGLIRGMNFRFAGLAPHANSMGGLTVIGLLLLIAHPIRASWLNRSAWALSLVVLLGAQSKTAWIALLIAALLMLMLRYGTELKQSLTKPSAKSAIGISIGILMSVFILIFVVATFGGGIAKGARFLESHEGARLLTLMGRFDIWRDALAEWERHPIFGYGPAIWDLQYRLELGKLFTAYHAHNQVLNVMAMAGTLGLLGFMAYLSILFLGVIRTSACSHGLSAAVFITIMVGSISEVPLGLLNYGVNTLAHFLLLALLVAFWPAVQGPVTGLSTARTRILSASK